MKELQNFVYRHMDALKHHKRYLAMLTALSMLVTFIVPLILMEPADSMSGILICGKTEHIHDDSCYEDDTLICGQELHTHSEACYLKYSAALKGASGNEEIGNIDIYNAGGGLQEDGSYESADAHKVEYKSNVVPSRDEYYNPKKLPLYTLLFGEPMEGQSHWVDTSKSLDENLLIANQEYFLGYASDFCAFIESDFTAFDADAEGRMFVGGDLIFKGIPDGKKWNYQVGAGDYGQFKPIWDTDEYGHLVGFASGIIGGKVYRVGTITTGAFDSLKFDDGLPTGRTAPRHTDGNDVMLYPEEGAYKRFVIGNLKDSLHYDEDGPVADIAYDFPCDHLYYDHACELCDVLSKEEMGTTTNEHSYLREVNELSQFYIYDDVSTILAKTFDTLRARSLSLASIDAIAVTPDNNTLTLDATNIGDAKTVYFKVNDWKNFDNILIKVPSDRATIGKSPYTNNNDTITDLNLNIIVSCDDKEIEIKRAITKVHVDGTDYEISKSGGNETNNHPVSSNILYNFYNASTVEFIDGCNFNGTIFAPNADASAPEECPGHLSGALIAKSFYGGLEFGYRPYRGGVDIFGMVSGYAIPVNKYEEGKVDANGNPAFLPGALFAIKEDAKFVSLFESGNKTNFAALPSRVDFTGNNKYSQERIEQSQGDRSYAGDVIDGEKLTAPVDFKLYSDSNCGSQITINTETNKFDIGNRVKFYLKPDPVQNVKIVENENFKSKLIDANNHIYEIQLIKPVNGSFDITVQNAYDVSSTKTVTINATQNMTLVADPSSCTEGDTVTITPAATPVGADKLYYQYFANGVSLNNNYVENQQWTDSETTKVPGNIIYSVKAYVNIDGEYYEVAQATSEKVTVKAKEVDISDIRISLDPNSLTTGGTFKVYAKNSDGKLPDDVNVIYHFGDYFTSGETKATEYTFQTVKDEKYIVGKDIPITVDILYNGKTYTLNDTVTVDFNNDIAFNDYYSNGKNVYYVGTDSYEFSLTGLKTYHETPSITYYFNNQPIEGNKIIPTLVADNIPVKAVISLKGLTKEITGQNVFGKYNDGQNGTTALGIDIEDGPYQVNDGIDVTLHDAPNGAMVVFKAYDSYNNVKWETDAIKVEGNSCSATFTPEIADGYNIKAFMNYEGNPEKELYGGYVYVVAAPLTGDLSINPSQINTGSEIEFKVYGATEGASVQFSIYDQNNNYLTALYGTVNNGECTATYRPTQAGGYSVKAFISKDGSQRETQQQWFTVKENTSTLTGEFDIINPNGQVEVKVYNATEGAVAKLTVTGPNNFSHTPSSNIVNGTYTFYFNPPNDGIYTVNVVLEKGNQTYDLGVRTFQRGDVSSVIKGTLSFSRDNGLDDYYPNEKLNITFTPEGDIDTSKSVQFDIYYYNKNNHLTTDHISYNSNGWTTTFTPGNKGNLLVTATIDGAVVAEASVTINAVFTFSDSENGKKIVTVSKTDTDEYISEIQEFSITDSNNAKHQVTDYNLVNDTDGKLRAIEFTPLAGVSGTLYLRVKLSGGAETYCYKTITVEGGNVSISSINQNIYALRKTLKILEDEGTDSTTTDNEILITAPDNGEIDSVRLVLPGDVNTENSFKIKVIFNNGNEDINPPKEYNTISTDSETGTKYIDISTAEYDNVRSIKIVPVIGSITVDKCYPKYKNEEYIVTKTIPRSFTLKKNEEKEIVLENWLNSDDAVQTLKSLTFNLTSAGSISYALIGKDDTSVPVFKTVQSQQDGDKIKVVINDINAANIEKIKIFTTANSLTVTEYTISAFIGSVGYVDENDNTNQTELNKFLNNNLDIINYYTLVEQQAPTGYFKENTVYTIEVKETIDLATLANGVPTKVLTTITVKDPNGSEKMKYTVDVTESRADNKTKRTLKIGDVEFTITKDASGNLTVTSTDANINTSGWATDKPAQYGNYYFDPAAMMIVPVPEPIVYKNTNGLLFRKVNINGASVFEVMIKMHEFVAGEWQDVPEWSWIKGKSNECLLSVSGDNATIKTGVYYRFHETNGGGKYLLADDIYMIRDSEDTNKIYYWSVDRKNTIAPSKPENPKSADNPNGYNVLDLTRENVIRMENQRLPGLKLTLLKTKAESETNEIISNDTNDANDAVFSLCAIDGTVLLNNVVVTNGQLDLDVSQVQNSIYVENGYIKPGTYYLKEIKPPSGREASVSDFYFTISLNKNYVYTVESAEILPGVLAIEERQSDGTTHKVLRFLNNALKQLHGANLDEDTPIIQFKFNTDSSQFDYGNASFSAKVNGVAVPPVKSAYPTGCNVHDNGISFKAAEVTVQLTVKQLCDLFGVSVENFNTITEFSVHCWNKTTTSDVDFYPIESTGGSSSGSGSTMTGGETIKNLIWNTERVPDYTVGKGKLTFYFVDGSSKTNKNEISITAGNWWHLFDLNEFTTDGVVKNVAAIQLEVSGETTNNENLKKLVIEDSGGQRIWGADDKDHNIIEPGVPYTFGSIPTTTTTTATTTTTTVETTTTTAAPIPTLTIDGSNLMVSNVEIGTDMDLRVKKRWAGDEDVTELRQPVKFQLWRKTVKDGNSSDYTPCDPYKNEDGTATGGLVTVGESDNWQYIWENLPRFVNSNTDGTEGLYYYKVTEVSEPKGYNQVGIDNEYSKDFNEGGTVVITNEADVIDIPISKTWDFGNCGKDVVPDSVMFKLMAKVGDEWIYLPGKTIVLTKPADWNGTDDWTGKFENLPVEFEYQVEECPLHYEHWDVDETNSKLTVTAVKPATGDENAESFAVENDYNVPTGTLEVGKSWLDNNDTANRPAQLKLNLYRTIAKPYYEETDIPYEGDYKSDYARLLQHSLYFYDANMCGADVSESSKLAWRSNCHIEDEVPGGYHDAGDHVMFGLPQGYTATMLSWMYLEFFKDGTNANTANKSIDSADKAHLKVILERFYDFFASSVKYDSTGEISEILVQKGHGNVDHMIWCSPEKQPSRVSEMIWSSTSGANIAAEYAAALALGYINFHDQDSTKYTRYLEVAKKLYRFAEKTSAFAAGDSMGSYYADGDKEDDMQLAAAWLYEATNDDTYKGKRLGSDKDVSKGLQWDDVQLAAAAATARQDQNWGKVTKFIDENIVNKDFYYIHSWGTARFNTMAQTAVLIAAKNNPDKQKTYVDWAVKQMNKILGDNEWKDTISTDGCTGGTVNSTRYPVCLVTNFAPDDENVYSPQAPHHRAASGWNTHEEYKTNCGYNPEKSYQLIGALVGGPAFEAHKANEQPQMRDFGHDHPLSNHNYIDDLHDYCCNEVAIDYNSGLVGAAAGLYYFLGTGERSTMIEGVEIEGKWNNVQPYTPDSGSAPVLYSEVVAKQVGYNMVPFRRTAVSVLNGNKTYTLKETYTTDFSFSDNQITLTNSITNISRIVVEFNIPNTSGFGGYFACDSVSDDSKQFSTNDSTIVNGKYEIILNSPTEIKYIKAKAYWNNAGATVNNVYFYEESTTPPEFGFTSDTPQDNTTHKLRQNITFKTNEAANWTASPNDSSIVQLTPSSDNKECTVKFLKYTGQAVTITATSISDPTKSVNRTISANKASLSLDKSELEVGENVTFTVNNVTNDGNITWEYYVNDTKLENANSNPYTYTYTAPTAGEKSVYAVAKSGDVEVDRTAAQTFTVKAAIPKINGASEMFEGETKTYELDGATSWKVETNTNFASIDENGNLSSIANVDNNTTVQISAKLGETTITKDVIIKPITISDQSMGTSETITVELGDVTGNYQWKVESETPAALGSISGDNAKCIINSSANTGSFIIGLYINDSNVTANKLTQFTVNVADGAFNLIADNNKTSINVGERLYMRADGRNNLRFEINSGSKYAAIVDNNNVLGLAPGTVTVVAIDIDKNERSVPYTITVSNDNLVINNPLKDINDLTIGMEKQFNANNNISNTNWNFNYNWYITNDKNTNNEPIVEVVESGNNSIKVKALKAGTFTLNVDMVYSQNNSNNIIAFTQSQNVTINDISGTIKIGDNLSSIEFDTPYSISVESLPDGYSYGDWSYSEGGKKVEFANNNSNYTITGKEIGETTINVKIKYSGNDVKTLSKTITITPPAMSLSLTSATIEIKDEIEIEALNVPENSDLLWSASGNVEIISKDDNKVRIRGFAIGSGTITVTATPKAATANEPMTVSEDETQTASAAIEVTNVPQYTDYYFIHKEVVNKSIPKDSLTDINVADLIGSNEVGKIVVKFNSNSASNYNGVIYYEGTTTEKSAETGYEFTASGPQSVIINITTPEVLKNLYIKSNWNEANSRIESIYFYGKVNGPTIVNAPASMIVGNEAKLGALGFTAGSTINWEIIEGSEYATIDSNGKLTANSVKDGTPVTIKVRATNANNAAETDEVSIKINGKPVTISANPSKIKFNGESTITSSQDSLKYTIKFENGASAEELFEIDNGILKLKDGATIGEETKKLMIQSVGTNTYAPSNAVSVIVYGGIFITGVDELPLSTEHRTSESKLTVKNALGEVTWSIEGEDNEEYVISYVEEDGSYIVTKDDKTILKLYSNGKIEAGTAAGMVTITATEDGNEATHTVKVTDLPMEPIIPTEGKTHVKEIILTANNSWKSELASLPTCDQKGNPYYYYFEEYAYTNSTANEGWTLIYSDTNLGYIHANGSYIPVDYVGNGSSLSSEVNSKTSFTIENKQTDKPQGTLPSTGGSGARTYYYLGGVIMLLGIAGFTGLKRRERKRRKEE